ncbi:hypothetical protein OC835_003050 [Tilletia horrida]|nr:hypothetical protein OC835_003050 [Tilletia horrida]
MTSALPTSAMASPASSSPFPAYGSRAKGTGSSARIDIPGMSAGAAGAASVSAGAGSASGAGAGSESSSPSASTSRLLGGALGGAAASWRAAQHRGSVLDEYPMYSCDPEDYTLEHEIGFGASSVVYEAKFKPINAVSGPEKRLAASRGWALTRMTHFQSHQRVAVKVIDLEAFGRDTDELRRETQLMSLSKHPNVLRVRGCYLIGSKLHIATRFMAAGSMLDIMKFSHPDGFDEIVIATVLKQALQGLHYLHQNDWLHRDLKAANILVDDDGTVLLGDFGVGVWLGESSAKADKGADEEEGGRKSFVGTVSPGPFMISRGVMADNISRHSPSQPAWMAPEVVERKHYGVKADIWSFGITALELCQGRAPHARFAPVKALMKTLSDEPPKLDRDGGAHKYSKAMEDFVRVCLQKDPAKRPTAEKLLSHALFKQARNPKFLVNAILAGLPPLSDRQERRRRISMSSMRTTQSWDFGSVGAGSGRWTPGTNTADRTDPFLGFSGIFGNAASPRGSVRSSKIVSFDGQHAFAVTPSQSQAQLHGGGDNLSVERRSRSISAVSAAAGGTNRRARNRSNDSGFAVGAAGAGTGGSFGSHGGLRALATYQREQQRRSISRDPSFDDGVPSPGEPQDSDAARQTNSHKDAHAHLETIGEQKSPLALAPEVSNVHVPILDLPPSPFIEDAHLQLSADSRTGQTRWAESIPSEPSSRAVSSSTTASKATSTSSATTVVTTEAPASASVSAAKPSSGGGGGGAGATAPGALSGDSDVSSTPTALAPVTEQGLLAGAMAAVRVNSRSSQKSASQPSALDKAQAGNNLFLSRIRSISSRPGSRSGLPPTGEAPAFGEGGGSPKLGHSPDDAGGAGGHRHRRTDSVLGKLFGRNKKESKG